MLTQIEPRLGRTDVMLNSFCSGVSDRAEKFSRAPEMPFSEIISEPRVLLQELKGSVALEQLQCLANAHCARHLNKEMHMVRSNMQLIDAEAMAVSNFMDKPFAVTFQAIELERVHGIFGLPHKVEGILPKGMIKRLQIHFFPPESARGKRAHANSNVFNSDRDVHSHPSYAFQFRELNFREDGIPPLLESRGTLPCM
jgi:hypothetical protein